MSLEGHVENGQIVLDTPAELPEGARVRVEVRDDPTIPTVAERFKDVIGLVEIPLDLAENHDHYLHGQPKRS